MFTKKPTILALSLVLVFVVALGVPGQAFDPAEEFGEIDFKGETVTYVGYYNPFEEWFYEGGYFPGRLEEAKEIFNIGEIEFLEVPWGEEMTEAQMARLMAGDSNNDIWMTILGETWSMAADGAYYPLSDILPDAYYDNMPQDIAQMFSNLEIEGTSYVFGVENSHRDIIQFVAWNRDLFEREGLPPLDELYLEGEWTWDMMEQIALDAQRDTTGDGEIDQLGISNVDEWILVVANGGQIVATDENGNQQFVMPDDEAALYGLEKAYEWVEEFGFGQDTWDAQAFRAGNSAMCFTQQWQFADIDEDMDESWSIVPVPRGPHADDISFPVNGFDSAAIPANADNPEGLVALHTFLYHPEEFEQMYENMIAEEAPDRISARVLDEARIRGAEDTFLFGDAIGYWDYEWTLRETLEEILEEGETAATALQAIRPEVQARLDETLGQ